MAGVTVYFDLNHSVQFVNGDPTAVSDGNGNFTIGLLAIGSYTIREDAVPGSVSLTTPAGGGATVNLTLVAPTTSVDFGQIQSSGLLPVVSHPNLYHNDTSDAGISFIKSLYHDAGAPDIQIGKDHLARPTKKASDGGTKYGKGSRCERAGSSSIASSIEATWPTTW